MSARITINIGFYFQKEHYSQLQAYIPRTQAIKIPGLMIEQRQQNDSPQPSIPEEKGRQVKSQSKKQSDQDISDQEDNLPQNDMELENQDNQMEIEDDNEDDGEGDGEGQGQVDGDADQQNQVERALKELEEGNYDSDQSSSDDDQDDIELSSLLSNQSPMKGYGGNKTKRQKGETKDLIQLPDRRPRKDKKVDEATQIIRREQKERKRKQYLKKQIEAQQKATLEKILNETGRKLRLREEKQIQDIIYREQKTFKTLGDVPKIITLLDSYGKKIMTHKTPLFPPSMTTPRDMRMRQICKVCNNQSKYKLKGCDGFVCSLPCYKTVMSR